jgi:hypothetical protein
MRCINFSQREKNTDLTAKFAKNIRKVRKENLTGCKNF